ncbi:hypothetical protein, partial [Novosphingobium sp. FSW06-99]|uniref:hypothetical protein n=1 Tax=Novosphingobium sp. FSW06-99 TaxID=1739113 RepID=UPI000B15E596
YENRHGIMFFLKGDDVVNVAGRNVSFLRDGKVVFRQTYEFELHTVFDAVLECLKGTSNPFAH